ncbi:MAG: PAS domain S-box protein [Fodinibius sp.]|nr:PAS domain S-box protein [Fodinibius sp.]
MFNSDTSFFDEKPLFVLDHASLDIIDVNAVALDLYGYSRQEFLSMNVKDLGQKKKRVDLIDSLSNDDGSVDKIWLHRTKSGKEIYIQFTYHTFYHNERPAKIAIAHDVSKQIKEQESKRTKFPKFITHETNFPLAEVEWNADLNVRNWSEKAQELFGWSEDEVIGEDNFFKKLVSEDELEKAQKNLRDALANGNDNYSVEGKANTKNGDTLVCEWHNSLIYDADNELHSMHSLVTDVSKRKESENLFRTLSEKSLAGVFLIQDGCFQYVNPRLAEIFGYDQQQIIDDFYPHELIHPDDQELIKANIKERLNGTPESEEYQVKGVTQKGRIIDISLYGAQTQYRGRPAVVGTVVDITKDKELVRKYRSSVETFQELFNSISDAVYIQDKEGTLLEVNQGTVEMYGYEKSYLKGQTPELLAALGKVDMDDMCEHIELALQGEPQSFNWWGRRNNGEVFPKEMVINRGKYFGKDVAITIARDISERYQAEEQLRKNEELFRQLFSERPHSHRSVG